MGLRGFQEQGVRVTWVVGQWQEISDGGAVGDVSKFPWDGAGVVST